MDISSSNRVAGKYASSPSSSYSNSPNSSTQLQKEKSQKPLPGYRSSLHSIRKLPGKNIIMKKPIAPMPPTPPKIYKVNPVDFKDVVQRLTGAVEFQPTRLQQVAPPPIQPSTAKMTLPEKSSGGSANEARGEISRRKSFDGNCGALMSPLGFSSLPPSSIARCSSILLSPGTVSSLEPAETAASFERWY